MNDRIPFQYAVLRYMHDVTTGEFLNVGLALYSPAAKYFQARLLPHFRRITTTFPEADGEFYRRYVSHLQTIANRLSDEINHGQLSLLDDDATSFEALLAQILTPDDSSLYFGQIYGGTADNLDEFFDQFYDRMVTRYLSAPERASRDDEAIWNVYRRHLQAADVVHQLRPHLFQTRFDPIPLAHSWKNGHWNAIEAVSFDLVQPSSIQRKASQWFGDIHALSTSPDWGRLYLLLGAPRQDSANFKRAYKNAKLMITDSDLHVDLVEEADAEEFAQKMRGLIDKH
jgi:hypothetical protein